MQSKQPSAVGEVIYNQQQSAMWLVHMMEGIVPETYPGGWGGGWPGTLNVKSVQDIAGETFQLWHRPLQKLLAWLT